MKNLTTYIKQHIWKILTVILALAFLTKGCTHGKVNQLGKKIEVLQTKVDSLEKTVDVTATSKEVRDEMEKVMLDYLIYEDDIDKGKTSLSNIKNKIESND
jgi:outer membrane murein-binding lipoprotein Lpp